MAGEPKPLKSKQPKPIVDVAASADTQPDTSSRPLVVSDRPILKRDPMMAEAAADPLTPTAAKLAEQPSEAEQVTSEAMPIGHQGRMMTSPDAVAIENVPEAAIVTGEKTIEPLGSKPSPATDQDDTAEPTSAVEDNGGTNSEETQDIAEQDALIPEASDIQKAAKADAVDEAALKRQAELDKLVANKTYFVSLGSSKAKRSRALAIWVILALVVLIVGFDVLLDAQVVKLSGIPHTHLIHTAAAPATSVSTPVTKAVVAAPNLLTYKSTLDGSSFTYPKDWKLTSLASVGDVGSATIAPSDALQKQTPGIYSLNLEYQPATVGQPAASSTYTIAAVSYTKLPQSSSSLPLYLQQFIVKADVATGLKYLAYLNIVNSQTLQVGQTIVSPDETLAKTFETLAKTFTYKTGGQALTFGGECTITDASGSTDGAATLEAAKAQAAMTIPKQCAAVLLSFTAPK
jgi:hypothetical protein